MPKKKSKDKLELPEGITTASLVEMFEDAETEYSSELRRMRILEGADTGKLWTVINANFPKYQITPDTNHVNKIKTGLLASIYSAVKEPNVIPRSQKDIAIATKINKVNDVIWDMIRATKYQRLAGERAALHNLGITQVGWKNDIIGGTDGANYRGNVVLKNIDPFNFKRDPYADSLENSRWCCTHENYNIVGLKALEAYKDRIKELEPMLTANPGITADVEKPSTRSSSNSSSSKNHFLIVFWVKRATDTAPFYAIDEIHLLDKKHVLLVKKDIKPKKFPFAMLYCNVPGSNLVGASEPALIFANSLSYNMINSIILTHAYKAQRPPRFVDMRSGINVRQISKYGNDADKTFLVNGDASQAIHYAQFPALPADITATRDALARDIDSTSSVNDRSTGQDTGSIITTGGMDTMMAAATAPTIPKIDNYTDYTKCLYMLALGNLIQYGDARTFTKEYPAGSNKFITEELDFKEISDNIMFSYSLDMTDALPRNKARLAQAANMLLEKQAQYNPNPEIITIEEWLMMQDLPFKDLIFDRIGLQRKGNMTEQVAQTLMQFTDLIQQGADPKQAMQMVVEELEMQQTPESLGNTAGPMAGSPQARQQGTPTAPLNNVNIG